MASCVVDLEHLSTLTEEDKGYAPPRVIIHSGSPRMANIDTRSIDESQRRRRQQQIESSDSCEDVCLTCCCCCCSLVGYIFCLKRMSRSLRIRFLWIWMNILCVTSGVITGVVVFGPNTYSFGPTDMRLLKDKSMGIFCESIEINPETSGNTVNSVTFSAYYLNYKPEVNLSKTEVYQDTEASFLDTGEHITRAFYFLRGSKVKISSCSDSFVELYIIKGKSNYNKWIDNSMLCFECYLDVVNILSDSCNRKKKAVYNLNVNENDDYYFVYVNRNQETWVTSEFYINRTLFNTSEQKNNCTNSYSCTFDVDFLSQNYIVIHAAPYTDYVDTAKLDISCQSRTYTYLTVFLVIPLLICSLISICIYRCCNDPTEENVAHINTINFPSERTPLLSNHGRHPVSGIIEPPKYEDIIRDETWKLPTYEEAISVQVQ